MRDGLYDFLLSIPTGAFSSLKVLSSSEQLNKKL